MLAAAAGGESLGSASSDVLRTETSFSIRLVAMMVRVTLRSRRSFVYWRSCVTAPGSGVSGARRPATIHGCCSACAAVIRFGGSTTRSLRTTSFAPADTESQCGLWKWYRPDWIWRSSDGRSSSPNGG